MTMIESSLSSSSPLPSSSATTTSIVATPFYIHRPWNRKPIPTTTITPGSSTTTTTTNPTFSLFDLISIGVGGTIGSGIFVLTGYVAHTYAGPATFVSFMLSGLAALTSCPSYAEFAAQLPSENGSTYTFAFVALGEYPAVLAGACLTLEYGVSGAAVARSWGDKVTEWMTYSLQDQEQQQELSGGDDNNDNGDGENLFNPLAGMITLLSTMVLAYGVQESKRVTHFFTILKVVLVIFMIVGGFMLFQKSNMDVPPLIKPELGGFDGILRGATSSFFGYLGFDQVCCMAAEAKHPGDPSKAALWTSAIVTTIYILASISLTGMLHYTEISETSGFPLAFEARGITWAAKLTAIGEVVTLPVVVLISLLAQPRLFAAMAHDGILPEIFARQTASGNLFWSSILCGVPMSLLAAFVPFSSLDDAISVGILVAFNVTNTSLILMKCKTSSATSSSSTNNNTANIVHKNSYSDDGFEMTSVTSKRITHSESDPSASSTSSSLSPTTSISQQQQQEQTPRRRSAPVESHERVDGIMMRDSHDHDSHENNNSYYTSHMRTSMIDRPKFGSSSLSTHLIIFHIVSFLSGLTSHLTRGEITSNVATTANDTGNTNTKITTSWENIVQVGSMISVVLYALYLHRKFPNTGRFGYDGASSYHHHRATATATANIGGRKENVSIPVDDDTFLRDDGHDETDYIQQQQQHEDGFDVNRKYIPFQAPCVPLLPLLGIFLNWYLIAQLEQSGILLLLLFLGIISLLYFACVNGRQRKDMTMNDSNYNHTMTMNGNSNTIHYNRVDMDDSTAPVT